MPPKIDSENGDTTTADFDRLLRAECDAKEAIENCQREAADVVNQARDRVRRITTRTDERISALQQRYNARIDAEIETLLSRAADEKRQRAAQRYDKTRLETAMARLAAWLTGETIDHPK